MTEGDGLAKSHAKATGQPLRLAEFTLKNQWLLEEK